MQLDITLDISVETPNNPRTLYKALTDDATSVANHFDVLEYDVTINRGD